MIFYYVVADSTSMLSEEISTWRIFLKWPTLDVISSTDSDNPWSWKSSRSCLLDYSSILVHSITTSSIDCSSSNGATEVFSVAAESSPVCFSSEPRAYIQSSSRIPHFSPKLLKWSTLIHPGSRRYELLKTNLPKNIRDDDSFLV